MEISMDTVKQLRAETGISVMQCKKALEEAGGDIEKARIALQKKGSEMAAKKADRTLGAGAVQAYIHASNDVGTIVLLSCETDFVSKNEEFISLAREIAMHITAAQPRFTSREDIPDDELARVKEAVASDFADKPADIQEKAIQGKLDAYIAECTLLEQPYIKDQDKTITSLLEEATQKFGERIEVTEFSFLSART